MSEEINLTDGNIKEIQRLRGLLAVAEERERVAREAYDGQQTSYRELEGLYTSMTERAQHAEQQLATAGREIAAYAERAEQAETERGHLLRIALAAWKLSEEISEFGQSVSSETVEALDRALIAGFGDTITNWYAVRDKIKALIEPKARAE